MKFLAGVEGSFTDSEYNLSQDHIAFFSASAIAGIDYEIYAARIGGRFGAGPFTTSDGRSGAQAFAELTATVPIRRGAGLRFGHRFVGHLDPAIRRGETSILLVASQGRAGSPAAPLPRWEFAATAGVSNPDSLNLRSAAFQRMTAMYFLGRDLQLQASWTATAHESTTLTTFMGYPGNERGKTIESFGMALRNRHALTDALSLHYSGGMELADWADEHQLLPVDAGTEYAFAGAASLRFAVAPHAAIEGGVERIVWSGLDMNETRWGIGLVLTR